MTTITDPPRESFRLSMLLNDTRYRSYTFQIIALVILFAAIAYLMSNLFANLRAAGLNISYNFLGEPAGYDINQRPIEYSSQSTHLRAAVVGVLNTLIVAFLACVTATIFGVIAGVLRLSNNWLVRKLMAVYVEAFRNVPVLIWIIIIFTVMTAAMPAPRAFRGENPEASMLFDAFAFTNRGVYIPSPEINGAFWLIVAIFVVSVIAAIGYRRYAKNLLFTTGKLLPMGWPTAAIILLPTMIAMFVPGNPLTGIYVVVYFVAIIAVAYFGYSFVRERVSSDFLGVIGGILCAFGLAYLTASIISLIFGILITSFGANPAIVSTVTFDFPALKGFNFQGGLQVRGSLIALWFALAIYTGAFIAENVRAGIQAISKGQTEAAASLGLRPGRIMNLVILPQALRVIIPPLISQYLNITKNSSLAIAVGYMDVTGTLGGITLNQTGRAIETVLLLMLFYLVISLSISALMNVYNNSMKLKER